MERTSNGYTIVEVMIVLTISMLLVLAAIRVFAGQNGETQFSQAMQDINSKIQNYVAQVKAGNAPDLPGYECHTNDGDVSLQPTGGASSYGECIFLGRAIQAVPSGSTLYVYTVLGSRQKYVGGTNTGQPATTITEANPKPAKDDSNNWVLIDEYQLPYGVKLVSAQNPADSGHPYNLLGIYTNLQSTNSGPGSVALMLRGYPFSQGAGFDRSPQLENCIEEQGACASAAEISQWDLCFKDPQDSRRAKLSISNRPTGIVTNLSFGSCS